MPTPKRPRDGNQLAKLVVDMATGEVPNDKEEILNPVDPPARANGAKAQAAQPDTGATPGGSPQGCFGTLGGPIMSGPLAFYN